MKHSLKSAVTEFMIVHGPSGYDALAEATGKSAMTIRRWLSSEDISVHAAFLLACAMGYSNAEAIKMAKDHDGSRLL